MNIDAIVRDNVKKMFPYSSARDDFEGVFEMDSIYLDANESPFDNGL